MTKYSSLALSSASYTGTMAGWFSLATSRASRLNRSASRKRSSAEMSVSLGLRTLIATLRCSVRSLAR